MSLLSRVGGVLKGAGGAIVGTIDSVLDAAARLDNDDDALSFGDFLAFFKRGTQATRAGTPIVMRDRRGNAVAPKGTLPALGVRAQPYDMRNFDSAGPGENIAGFVSGLDQLFRPPASTIRRNLIEPVTSRIPEPVRDVGKFGYDAFADPIAHTVDLMNDAYNGVSRGLSTVILASELRADREFQETIKNMPLLEQLGYVNRLAWDAAKETSPGQAVMYAVLGGNHVDITDPDEVARILDSPFFDYGSGAIDAGLRIYADPTAVLAGGAIRVTQARRVKQAAAFASESATAVGTVAERAAGIDRLYDAARAAETPAEFRRAHFPSRNNQAAHIQATALWDAAHMPDEVVTAPLGRAQALHAPQTAGGLNPTPEGALGPRTIGTGETIIESELGAPTIRGTGGSRGLVDLTPNQASREKFNTLMRAMLGNDEASSILRTADAATAEQVAFAQQLRNWMHPIVTPDPNNPLFRVSVPEDLGLAGQVAPLGAAGPSTAAQRLQLDDVIDSLIPQAVRASREADLIGTLAAQGGTVPRVTRANTARMSMVRSDFYQTHPLGKTLRVFADFNPQRRINLHEADFDVHVDRLLTNVGLDQAQRDFWRTRAMRATGAGERRAILSDLDNVVIDHYAATYNIDPDLIRAARDKARTEIDDMLVNAKYDTETETTILRTINEAGEYEEFRLPLHPTQLENWGTLPDYKLLNEIARTKAGKYTTRESWMATGDAALNTFYRVWKPAVLFGTRTPIRVVGEEAVRFMSVAGAIDATRAIGKTVGMKLGDVLKLTDEELRYLPPAARRPVTSPMIEGAAVPSLGAEGALNVYAGALEASAGGVLPYAVAQDVAFSRLIDSFDNWRTLSGTDPGHMQAWLNDINKQIRGSRLARKLLDNGGDIDDAVTWLRTSHEGKTTMRANRLWARDPEGWAMSIQDQIGRYLPTDELRAAASQGAISEETLTRLFPEAASRPPVHGQLLAYTIGRDHVSRTFTNILNRFHERTAVEPSIQLTRHNMFDSVYRRSIEDQTRQAIRLGRREPWTMEELRQVERNAHRTAMGEVRETLFDMAEYSRFAEATRFVAPFANATREVITTWFGIALRNPAFVRRMQIAWKAPERAGWIYDVDGNQVHEDGSATSPQGVKVKASPGRMVRVRFPDWAQDVPVLGKVVPDNGVLVNKDSLNSILANPYGSSPVIEVALARLVDDAASETQLKPFFPYGIDRSFVKPLLPSAVRAAIDTDREAKASLQIYWGRVAEYEKNGRQGPKPTMQEAKQAAAHFKWLDVLAKMVLPASVRPVVTPMQPYIDIYKEMQRNDPEHAQETFLEKYGVEFASLTLAMTKTIDGVQPTLEAWRRRGELEDFIAQYPELGAVAIGEVSDPFNPAVYDRQLRTRVGGENYDPQRRQVTPNEAQELPEIAAGWHEFSRAMDLIEAERIRRKLPNLRVKGASQLAAVKKLYIEHLSEKYKAWGDAYRADDPAKYEHRIEGMRQIVQRLGGSGRTDIDYLGHYLDLRDTIEGVLNQRVTRNKSGMLDSATNRDLLIAWETGVGNLVQSSPAFQRLWNRYLDHDAPRGHKAA